MPELVHLQSMDGPSTRTAATSLVVLIYSLRVNASTTWPRRFAHCECVVTSSWRDVERNIGRALGLVIEVPDIAHWPDLLQLRMLRRDPVLTPLLIVTDRDAENVRALAGIVFTEVTWSGSDASGIVKLLDSAANAGRVREMIGHSIDLTPVARRAAEAACLADPPLRSVEALAAAVGVDRKRLWAEWKRSAQGSPTVPLYDFVRWIVLIRAICLKRPGLGWSGVAGMIGINQRTVFRLAQSYLGVRPRELAAVTPTAVLERFRTALAGADGGCERPRVAS